MSQLSLLPFPPQNQPAPPSNCPAQTEPSRRKLPALQGLAVLSRLRRVSAPCTTAISFPLARLAAKMLCRSWSHLFFFFLGEEEGLASLPQCTHPAWAARSRGQRGVRAQHPGTQHSAPPGGTFGWQQQVPPHGLLATGTGGHRAGRRPAGGTGARALSTPC